MFGFLGDLIARFYIWHGTFIIDSLSVIPGIAEVQDNRHVAMRTAWLYRLSQSMQLFS